MNIHLFKCSLINDVKRFEELKEDERYSVFPLPVSRDDFNIVCPVKWDADSNNGVGSGFKYMLITKHNRINNINHFCTGIDTDVQSLTIVSVQGCPADLIKLNKHDCDMLPDRGNIRADADAMELLLEVLANVEILKTQHKETN